MAKILITGGSGLLGKAISLHLLDNGHTPVWLSRNDRLNQWGIKVYKWDLKSGDIDPSAFDETDHVVHLAGAGIMDKRWSIAYKKELIASRVRSSEMLLNGIKKNNSVLKSFVGASGAGYYGTSNSMIPMTEENQAGKDFVSHICEEWEKPYKVFQAIALRAAVLRFGVVLSAKGGSFPKLATPVRMGLGANFATGKQGLPWVHVKDAVKAVDHALFNNDVSGTYNVAAGEPICNKDFNHAVASCCNKRIFLPNIPEKILRLALGERATILTRGQALDNSKLLGTGFQFEFTSIEKACCSLLK